MANPDASLIKSEDRTADGNLLPEARDRVLEAIRKHLKQTGYVNVSELALKLGLSRPTTKNLVDQILRAWDDEMRNQGIAQFQNTQAIIEDLNENPKTFTKEKIARIKLKLQLLTTNRNLMKIFIIKKP